MRKLLIGILIIVLLVLAGYMLVDRVSIGSLEILGIEAIVEKNDKLEQKIIEATKLVTVTYQEKLNTLNSANKKLQQEKQSYENYVSADNGTGAISQIQSYEVEYLWTKIGNYAKREGVVLKMDVAVNNAVLKTYDLNFTVAGTYVGITEFIYDIDNDSSLLFKVENFKLLPNSSQTDTNEKGNEENKENDKNNEKESANESTSEATLVATFTCKDISINLDSSAISQTGDGMELNKNEPTDGTDATQTDKNKTETNTNVTE